tara:strand:+ start:3602 stop:3805 length:204 start_codon:yes stop_codon:yes gene_type:complete
LKSVLKKLNDKINKEDAIWIKLCQKITVNQKLDMKVRLMLEEIEDGLKLKINKNIVFMDVPAAVAGI